MNVIMDMLVLLHRSAEGMLLVSERGRNREGPTRIDASAGIASH